MIFFKYLTYSVLYPTCFILMMGIFYCSIIPIQSAQAKTTQNQTTLTGNQGQGVGNIAPGNQGQGASTAGRAGTPTTSTGGAATSAGSTGNIISKTIPPSGTPGMIGTSAGETLPGDVGRVIEGELLSLPPHTDKQEDEIGKKPGKQALDDVINIEDIEEAGSISGKDGDFILKAKEKKKEKKEKQKKDKKDTLPSDTTEPTQPSDGAVEPGQPPTDTTEPTQPSDGTIEPSQPPSDATQPIQPIVDTEILIPISSEIISDINDIINQTDVILISEKTIVTIPIIELEPELNDQNNIVVADLRNLTNACLKKSVSINVEALDMKVKKTPLMCDIKKSLYQKNIVDIISF